MIKGEKKGKIERIEEGERNAKIEIAKKMLQKKNDVNLIMELTGLTQAEIESLSIN
jgi:predicted transposase/invertase (TIGR01784 family)